MLNSELFDYNLPEDLVAQEPAARRDASRLLVFHRSSGEVAHASFADIGRWLPSSGLLVRNAVSVLPARLFARRPSGGRVECLLLEPAAPDAQGEAWWCLLRPGRKLPPGSEFGQPGAFRAEVLRKEEDSGRCLVRFHPEEGRTLQETANRFGEVPLPPYIHQAPAGAAAPSFHRERYQTVYADPNRQLAVAAPTAGLHFTPELLERLGRQGLRSADIVLHVGLGTFRPIQTATVEEHPMHRESYEIPAGTRSALLHPPGPRIAVGTTVVRAVEDFFMKDGRSGEDSFEGEADLMIRPPFDFRGVDALITNFHLPRSTLLCLVAAFLSPGDTAGIPRLHALYREAIRERYRFLSYGDAMLIV